MSGTVRLPRIRRFPVEAGHIQLFARAVGDPNPIYSDSDYAVKSSLGSIIAPPTFSEAANHFDEDWPYRPRWGEPWFGSAATPSGAQRPTGQGGTDLHAETHFTYHRPMVPGMVLSATSKLGREWTKAGQRSGLLKFHEIVTSFRTADGLPVVDSTTVVMRTEHTVIVDLPPKSEREAPKTEAAARYAPPASAGRSPPQVGDELREILVRNLSRAQIIQYAGVSGDFSPQHVDEVFNTEAAGYPTVFAHGMLTMGMAGRVLTDFVGDARMTKYGFQFRRQVWPGDSLFASLKVTNLTGGLSPLLDLEIRVTNQHDQLIGKGYAAALLGGEDRATAGS